MGKIENVVIDLEDIKYTFRDHIYDNCIFLSYNNFKVGKLLSLVAYLWKTSKNCVILEDDGDKSYQLEDGNFIMCTGSLFNIKKIDDGYYAEYSQAYGHCVKVYYDFNFNLHRKDGPALSILGLHINRYYIHGVRKWDI